jgi:hypothetical protein
VLSFPAQRRPVDHFSKVFAIRTVLFPRDDATAEQIMNNPRTTVYLW